MNRLFDESDRARVMAAVREAEKGTSGEIVPYVIDASDRYVEATWRAAAVAVGIVLFALGMLSVIGDTWMTPGIAVVAMIALAAGLLGGIVVSLAPPLRRLVAGNEAITRRVAQRAAQAFLAEEVFRTRERVGILIFLSIMERRVVVLGDAGINASVEQSEWNGIVETIVASIRAGKPVEGLVAAIGSCGAILRERGFAIQPDDINELPDELRGEL